MKTYNKPIMTISEYLDNVMFESGNALSDTKTDWIADPWTY